MLKMKAWVSAARLRTLPLSLSGILVGSALGYSAVQKAMRSSVSTFTEYSPGSWMLLSIFGLAILTTLGLQILSNFANDYGDGVKGTDNSDRVGPKRAYQSGVLSSKELVNAIKGTALFSLSTAILLIYVAFGSTYFWYSLFFLVLGIAAIIAAIKYTMGDTAYGYRGFGDIFVFVFFGIVSVVGCFFLYTKNLEMLPFLPAIAIGLLSTAVLNLNNLRDHDNDKASNKNTLVVQMGIANAKRYHYGLVLGAMFTMIFYVSVTYQNFDDLLFTISFIPLGIHVNTVFRNQNTKDLDPELKKVALSTFVFSLLFCVGILL